MKVIYNKWIPFKGFKAITLFNVIFVREEYKNSSMVITNNHESIHQAQAYDFGIGFFGYFIFYILYLLEWLFKVPWAIFKYKPYYSISFEQEALNNDRDLEYLENRKRFAWVKYIFKMVKK